MKTEIVKPNKNNKEPKSLITPIVYLFLGVILAFKSNEATKFLFWIIGVIVILYGIKTLIEYYHNKDLAQYKNINLTIAIASIIIGLLLIILANAIEIGLRYILGFFLIYFGVSRILTQISFQDYKNMTALSNIILIIMGIYSIFVSNAIFVVIGWILIANAVLLLIDYVKH